eukprot:TRINITY_DN10783_c0_g1_i1.p1 TRINITY_DN10783_c0_g1~~TRINITY_DN10783_c0_g1_i1.p1  ORF type:complete len:269 (+),score=48.02 TRINITY_DN10783_c0_g1_i1:1-807(+)
MCIRDRYNAEYGAIPKVTRSMEGEDNPFSSKEDQKVSINPRTSDFNDDDDDAGIEYGSDEDDEDSSLINNGYDMKQKMEGWEEGTIAFNVERVKGRRFMKKHVFVLIGHWEKPLTKHLDKKRAPSESVTKTPQFTCTTKKPIPEWHEELHIRVSSDILRTTAGIQIQVFGFRDFIGDEFLGEVLLTWKQFAGLCDGNTYILKLQQSRVINKSTAGYASLNGGGFVHLSASFRPSTLTDFGGLSFGLLFRKLTGNYKPVAVSSMTDERL